MISDPTRRISFGPNSISPTEMPSAPTTITQTGMPTVEAMSPTSTECTMAASGPTALATSFAPCAKESSAAEATSGSENSLRSERLRFSSPSDWCRISGTEAAQHRTPVASPISVARPSETWNSLFSPLIAR